MNKTIDEIRSVKSPIVWAVVIAIVISLWLLSGVFRDNVESEQANATRIDEGEELYHVRAMHSQAELRASELTVRGRTQALRTVAVRAETAGTVVGLPVEKGALVQEGDVLCELAVEARDARLAEAKAAQKQRTLEWQAAKRLMKQGHRSETQTAAVFTAMEQARSAAAQAEIELSKTKLISPFTGIFDDRKVEVGDFIQPGQECGTVVAKDPFLVVAQISEKNVGYLKLGAAGRARLITGEDVEGVIRFISTRADPLTRTFRVELEIPNPDGTLRDGVTSDLIFPMPTVLAHKLTPAILGLDDKGVIGVRVVKANDKVGFVPVEVISDVEDGVWVTGLPERTIVITAGQEVVVPGQKVQVTIDDTIS